MPASLTSLANELLAHILRDDRLYWPDLAHMARVCRSLSPVAQRELYRFPVIRGPGRYERLLRTVSSQRLRKDLAALVMKLEWSLSKPWDPSTADFNWRLGDSFNDVVFPNCRFLSLQGDGMHIEGGEEEDPPPLTHLVPMLRHLFAAFPALSELQLSQIAFGGLVDELRSLHWENPDNLFPPLQKLRIVHYHWEWLPSPSLAENLVKLAALFGKIPTLRSLHLEKKDVSFVVDEIAALSHFEGVLDHLHISGNAEGFKNTEPFNFGLGRRLPSLQSLEVDVVDAVRVALNVDDPPFQHLRSLNLYFRGPASNLKEASAEAPLHLLKLAKAGRFPALESVQLQWTFYCGRDYNPVWPTSLPDYGIAGKKELKAWARRNGVHLEGRVWERVGWAREDEC